MTGGPSYAESGETSPPLPPPPMGPYCDVVTGVTVWIGSSRVGKSLSEAWSREWERAARELLDDFEERNPWIFRSRGLKEGV